MKEVEVKILDVSPGKIRNTLRKNRARFAKKVLQTNSFFENQHTKKNRMVVRIRTENNDAWMTIKYSPKIIRGHKVRHEHETRIEKPKFWEEALVLMGLKKIGIGDVLREYYKLNGCSVEIIKLPEIPHFIEIEGTEKNIKKVANLLGYTEKDYSTMAVFDFYRMKSRFLRFNGGKKK